jgi:hypothetical protein
MAANASGSSSPIRPTRINISIPQSTDAPPIVHETLRSSGQPLGFDNLRLYEPKFGHDFSKVRIHSDRQAAESSAAIDAVAYTSGNHIVFAEGKYAPGTDSGRRLLAHELTHVVQQSRGQPMVQREPDGPMSVMDAPGNQSPAQQPAPAPPSKDERTELIRLTGNRITRAFVAFTQAVEQNRAAVKAAASESSGFLDLIPRDRPRGAPTCHVEGDRPPR